MATAGSVVSVLAPNGRRVTTKVSPGTVLLQVLEEICRKQDFNPDEYDLKFQRTVLDLSQQWRFANLPNNAKLEMVPASSLRTGNANKVRIALQLEDGSRLQEEFLSSQTLWELLQHFPQTRACLEELCGESSPVCVYMRDQVTGEDAMKKTTLGSLGMTKGSSIVRFFIKKSCSVSHSDSVGLWAPTSTPFAQDDLGRSQPVTTPPLAKGELGAPHPMMSSTSTQADTGCLQPITSATSAQSDPGRPLSANSTTLACGDQGRPKPVAISQSGHGGTQSISSTPFAVRDKDTTQVIDGAGGAVPSTGLYASQPPMDSLPHQPGSQNLGHSESKSTDVKPSTKDKLPSKKEIQSSHRQEAAPPTCLPPFIPFTGGGQRLGGSTGECSPSVKEAPLLLNLPTSLSSPGGPSRPKKIKTLPEQKGGSLPVERQAVVCHLDLEDSEQKEWQASGSEDLPDDFFDITVDDVRKRLAQLKSERQRLMEMPLMTTALRDAQKREKLDRYPKIVLRVLFPDRYTLQGFFHPEETIGALRDFVKSHLEDETVPFYLFITPPRALLNDKSETLFQANLFPAAVVHFGSEVGKDHYLSQRLLDSIVSPSLADLLVARSMPRSQVTVPSSLPEASAVEEVASLAVTDDTETAAVAQTTSTGKSDPAKVPKWLKLPGKK